MAIGIAALGTARTTRQGRGMAIAIAVIAVIILRIGGFAVSSLIVRTPMAVPLAYAVPLLGALAGFFVLLRPLGVLPPAEACLCRQASHCVGRLTA